MRPCSNVWRQLISNLYKHRGFSYFRRTSKTTCWTHAINNWFCELAVYCLTYLITTVQVWRRDRCYVLTHWASRPSRYTDQMSSVAPATHANTASEQLQMTSLRSRCHASDVQTWQLYSRCGVRRHNYKLRQKLVKHVLS